MVENKKKILVFCNKLGRTLFRPIFDVLERDFHISFIIRDDNIPTDLKSSNYSFFRLLRKTQKRKHVKSWIEKSLQEIDGKVFDRFLAIGYYQVTSELIVSIKRSNPNCKTTIYFYDSFCRLNFSNDIPLFDECFTFDREDAMKYNINYLPFFVLKESEKRKVNIDICHIGSWSPGHVYRLPVLEKIRSDAKERNLNVYFKCTYQNLDGFTLSGKVKFFVSMIINQEYRNYFSFYKKYKKSDILVDKRFDYSFIQEKETESKCVVEINAKRAGLSPRVMNALANGRKVIINNPEIKKEIFYNEKNILIVDEKDPKIDYNFIKEVFAPFNFDDLEIENWIGILLYNHSNKYNVI